MNADNTIILNGRLTRDVELSHMQDGKAVAKFTVAVNRAYKDANGERQADFHNCVIFGNRAEAVANYFHKGDMIGVAGELRDNNYEKDGVQHYNKQIVVDSFGFRGQNSQNNNDSGTPNNGMGEYNQQTQNTTQGQYGANNTSQFGGFSNQQANNDITVNDTDLPF